jgi:hypothetical protein
VSVRTWRLDIYAAEAIDRVKLEFSNSTTLPLELFCFSSRGGDYTQGPRAHISQWGESEHSLP